MMDKNSKQAQTKVKVVVRVRPTLTLDSNSCVTVTEKKVQIINHRNKEENLAYEFSSVYGPDATQKDIFSECVEPLLTNVLHGQNVSVFAYGPTGAGKTHTMLGVMSDPGIVPRAIKCLFEKIAEEEDATKYQKEEDRPKHSVTFSYLEIYNEKVQDLLLLGNQDLAIREDALHNIFVAGLTEKPISSFETFKSHFEPAALNRTVAATKLNEHSSRSHSILLLHVTRRAKNKTYRGKIYLIDLAGSEDNRRTGNKGIRLKESGAINKSLFVLGEVVDAINHNQPRVPYRNSKLTRLLQDSLGGSCTSVMITAIAPEQHYYYDTYCTLNFATKSRKIVNVVTKNIKEDNPPVPAVQPDEISAKPTAAVRPIKRRSSLIPVTDSKRPRRSSDFTTSSSASASCSKAKDLMSLPSPLLRHQKQLESAVNEKLQEMERVLQDLKKSAGAKKSVTTTPGKSKLRSCHSTPVLPIKVSSSNSRTSVGSAGNGRSPDVICPTPDVLKTTGKLTDRTNVLPHNLQQLQRERSKKLQLKKVKKVEELSCSPLFPDTPVHEKKKKTTKRRKSNATPTEKVRKAASRFNNHEQFQRNVDFLHVLNTATVKELQQLQTVGIKRAKAIYDWRQIHGHFSCTDALKDIPGFTDKFIKNLLLSNLVTHAGSVDCTA